MVLGVGAARRHGHDDYGDGALGRGGPKAWAACGAGGVGEGGGLRVALNAVPPGLIEWIGFTANVSWRQPLFCFQAANLPFSA